MRYRPNGAIVGLLLLVLSLPAYAEISRVCGEVSKRGDCQIFTPYWPSGEYGELLLPDSLSVPYRTELAVTGNLDHCHYICNGIPYFYCLTGVVVEPCVPESLGCGVLEDFNPESGYGCITWTALDHSAGPILVGNLNGYVPGDTVFAVGIRRAGVDICICGCGFLLHEQLSACVDTSAAVSGMSWGRVKALYHE